MGGLWIVYVEMSIMCVSNRLVLGYVIQFGLFSKLGKINIVTLFE
jgi:hypothetical protein